MKNKILALSMIALLCTSCASTTQADENDFLYALGLIGFGALLGDGHNSFGVHFHHNGYYNYRGSRYYDRITYLRAVERFERQRRLSARYNSRHDIYYSGPNTRITIARQYPLTTYRNNRIIDRRNYNSRRNLKDNKRVINSRSDDKRIRRALDARDNRSERRANIQNDRNERRANTQNIRNDRGANVRTNRTDRGANVRTNRTDRGANIRTNRTDRGANVRANQGNRGANVRNDRQRSISNPNIRNGRNLSGTRSTGHSRFR